MNGGRQASTGHRGLLGGGLKEAATGHRYLCHQPRHAFFLKDFDQYLKNCYMIQSYLVML